MKIQYGTKTLGDDATGDKILDHGGGHSRVVEQTALAGGVAPATFARGNHSNQRSFTIDKLHASAEAATEFWNIHPDELPDSGLLRITERNKAMRMADAVLQTVDRVELNGMTTVLRYSFTGGKITQSI